MNGSRSPNRFSIGSSSSVAYGPSGARERRGVTEEALDGGEERVRRFNVRHMPALVEHHQPRVGEGARGGLGRGEGDRVLTPVQHQHGASHPSETGEEIEV